MDKVSSRHTEKDQEMPVDLRVGTLGYANGRFAELGYIREYTVQQEYDKMLPVLGDELGADLDALMNDG